MSADSNTIRRGYPFSPSIDGASLVIVGNGFPMQTHVAPFSLTAEQTSTIPPGRVRWETADDQGRFVCAGEWDVVETAKNDGETAIVKSFAEKALVEVEKLLLVASTDAVQQISVEGKSMSFYSHEELLKYRGWLISEIRREKYGHKGSSIGIRRGVWPTSPPWLTA